MNPAASTVALIFGAVVISGLAGAQQGERGGHAPSLRPTKRTAAPWGEKLPTKVTVRFGLRDMMGVAPSGGQLALPGPGGRRIG